MNSWIEYNKIKLLFDEYCVLKEGIRYEDFIKELTKVLNL